MINLRTSAIQYARPYSHNVAELINNSDAILATLQRGEDETISLTYLHIASRFSKNMRDLIDNVKNIRAKFPTLDETTHTAMQAVSSDSVNVSEFLTNTMVVRDYILGGNLGKNGIIADHAITAYENLLEGQVIITDEISRAMQMDGTAHLAINATYRYGTTTALAAAANFYRRLGKRVMYVVGSFTAVTKMAEILDPNVKIKTFEACEDANHGETYDLIIIDGADRISFKFEPCVRAYTNDSVKIGGAVVLSGIPLVKKGWLYEACCINAGSHEWVLTLDYRKGAVLPTADDLSTKYADRLYRNEFLDIAVTEAHGYYGYRTI